MTINFCLNKISIIQIVPREIILFYILALDDKKVIDS